MNSAVRIEEKRRKQLREQLEKQRFARLAHEQASTNGMPEPRDNRLEPHVHIASHGSRREQVLDFIRDGALYTIPDIGNTLGFKHTSVAALLRDLRKPKYGGHTIEVIREGQDHYFRFVR